MNHAVTQVDRGTPRRKLQLAEGVRIEFGTVAEDPVNIRWQGWALPLGVLTPALREAAGSLADGVDEEDAALDLRQQEGMRALARWSWLVQTLLDAGTLRCTLSTAAGDPLATISALAPGPTILLAPFRSSEAVTLSRFAWLRAMQGMTVLESPLSRARIQLHDPRLAGAVAALALPSTVDRLAASAGLPAETAAAFLGLLRGACALATPSETDITLHPPGSPSGKCTTPCSMSTADLAGEISGTAQPTASAARSPRRPRSPRSRAALSVAGARPD